MKSYTDINQSRTLAEFLPHESADMIWVLANPDLPMIKAIAYEDSDKDNKYYEILPAWSLSALLGLMPRIEHLKPFIDLSPKLDSEEVSIYYHSEDSPYIIKDNPLDAAFEMVCWLKENGKI